MFPVIRESSPRGLFALSTAPEPSKRTETKKQKFGQCPTSLPVSSASDLSPSGVENVIFLFLQAALGSLLFGFKAVQAPTAGV